MSAEVESILRSFWEWRLRESPEFATQIGVHTFDSCLDVHSLDAYAKRKVKYSLTAKITGLLFVLFLYANEIKLPISQNSWKYCILDQNSGFRH